MALREVLLPDGAPGQSKVATYVVPRTMEARLQATFCQITWDTGDTVNQRHVELQILDPSGIRAGYFAPEANDAESYDFFFTPGGGNIGELSMFLIWGNDEIDTLEELPGGPIRSMQTMPDMYWPENWQFVWIVTAPAAQDQLTDILMLVDERTPEHLIELPDVSALYTPLSPAEQETLAAA